MHPIIRPIVLALCAIALAAGMISAMRYTFKSTREFQPTRDCSPGR